MGGEDRPSGQALRDNHAASAWEEDNIDAKAESGSEPQYSRPQTVVDSSAL